MGSDLERAMFRAYGVSNFFVALGIACLCSMQLPAQVGDFGGPSILSRGGASPGRRGNTPMNFIVFGGVSGTLTTDPTGTGGQGVAYGESINIGLLGSHSTASSFIGVDYLGSYHKYNNYSQGNGLEQTIALSYDRRLTRRWYMNVRESASISKLALGGLASYGFFTNDLIGVPVNNLFNEYVYSSQTSGSATWQPSGRFSVAFFGDFFQVHRTAEYLVGVRGYRAGVSAARKVTRWDELNVGYNFIHFSYPRAFGTSDLHGLQAGWNRRFSRSWSGRVYAGAYRVETLGTQSVTLPPEVAEILGRSTGIRAVYRVSYAPNYGGAINYTYNRSNFTLSGTAGVSPGNGVYLTSRTNTANVGYSYSGFRKASFSVNFGYVEYSSLFQQIGKYSAWQGGLSGGYRITDHISVTTAFDIRQFEIETGRKRLSQTATVGITVAPYRVPIPSF
jgi:hypothetical protein